MFRFERDGQRAKGCSVSKGMVRSMRDGQRAMDFLEGIFKTPGRPTTSDAYQD
jgi:hypothetical protein